MAKFVVVECRMVKGGHGWEARMLCRDVGRVLVAHRLLTHEHENNMAWKAGPNARRSSL